MLLLLASQVMSSKVALKQRSRLHQQQALETSEEATSDDGGENKDTSPY